jgi:hypothetical protein
MEMRFFGLVTKYDVSWHPGQENLADYQSKHHNGAHHKAVCPWYLHQANTLQYLPRAVKPSALKGCVGALKDGYLRKVPLPRVPRIQSMSEHVARTAAVTSDSHDTCCLQVKRVPTWSDLRTLHLFG